MTVDFSRLKCDFVDPEIKQKLLELLKEYSFSMDTTDLGCTDKIEMNIELNTEKPVCYRPYRLAISEKEIVRVKIGDL